MISDGNSVPVLPESLSSLISLNRITKVVRRVQINGTGLTSQPFPNCQKDGNLKCNQYMIISTTPSIRRKNKSKQNGSNMVMIFHIKQLKQGLICNKSNLEKTKPFISFFILHDYSSFFLKALTKVLIFSLCLPQKGLVWKISH